MAQEVVARKTLDKATGNSSTMSTSQPIVPLEESQAPYFAGIDVGGTNIKIGIVDDRGRTLAFESIATFEPKGPQQAVDRAAQTIRDLATKAGIELNAIPRVGLGTPGTMCLRRGMLLDPPNLPTWHYFTIHEAMCQATQKPVSYIRRQCGSLRRVRMGTGTNMTV